MAAVFLLSLNTGNAQSQDQEITYIGDLTGLERSASIKSEEYIRRGTDFTKYKRFIATPLIFDFNGDQGAGGLSDEDLTIIQDAYRVALRKHIASKYPSSTEAASDVMMIRAVIRNLELARLQPSMKDLNSFTFSIEPGAATIQLTFSDSLSGKVVAAVVNRHEDETGSQNLPKKISTRSEAEQATGYWAELIRKRWDTARSASR